MAPKALKIFEFSKGGGGGGLAEPQGGAPERGSGGVQEASGGLQHMYDRKAVATDGLMFQAGFQGSTRALSFRQVRHCAWFLSNIVFFL